MRALHSSAALVVNIFDYWTLRDKAPLAAALGLEEQIISIEFEAQFPTHLDGKPPNLDLAIQTASGTTVAVESKFTEWLARKAANRKCFKPKYFPGGEALWEARGLAACQRLASQIDKGVEYFRYLDAPQLLKHALGLATQCSRPFFLHYFYFDYTCPESFSHRAEIDRFSSLVGSELGFRTLTFREFFQRLCGSTTLSDNEYIAYLRARYFENAAESDRSAKG